MPPKKSDVDDAWDAADASRASKESLVRLPHVARHQRAELAAPALAVCRPVARIGANYVPKEKMSAE